MSNTQPNKVITANHLLNGNVVYLNSQFDWVHSAQMQKLIRMRLRLKRQS